jgi:DMSO/TMAO reductase YedYZ heme-binding membrane subunit
MSVPLAAVGPSAYWYLTRGTGIVALVLLTGTVVLGILGTVRFAVPPRWPRFAIDSLHRDMSLLVLVFLVLHIVTSVLDSFAPIKLTDAVIPFASKYRPLWVGFGALSFDILIAIVVTSLMRRRLGLPAWRAVHWLAYLSWPVAVLHGLGTGSDTKLTWMLAITAACVAAVAGATVVRIARARPEFGGLRTSAIALTIAVPLGLAVFTLAGPLQSGWARRAGTPASLLAHPTTASASPAPVSAARPPARPAAKLRAPFSAQLSGTISQTDVSGGSIIDLALRLTGGAHGQLRVRLAGAPLGGGGLSMTGSQVDLLATGLPSVMQGQVTSLQGDDIVAHVTGASEPALDLNANLTIDQQSGSVTGTLSATSSGGGP